MTVVELIPGFPDHPPWPSTCILLFQFAGAGSQISIPMPAEVDGAPAGPGLPGPTISFTRQTSLAAVGGGGVAGAPDSASKSPFLKALTSVTVVLASGLKAVFIVSSHTKAVGAGVGAAASALLPPQASSNAAAAATSQRLADLGATLVSGG